MSRIHHPPAAVIGLLPACGLLMGFLCDAAAGQDVPAVGRVVPVDGEGWQARLTGVTPRGDLTFEGQGSRKTLAWNDLVQWGTPHEPHRDALVVTTGGSWLAGEVLETAGEQLTIRCRAAGRRRLPLTRVRGILFTLPFDPAARDRRIERIERATRDCDQILLANGDVIGGTLVGIDGRTLSVETAGGMVKIRRTQALAYLADPALLEPPSDRFVRHGWIGLRDGSFLRVGAVARKAGAPDPAAAGAAAQPSRRPTGLTVADRSAELQLTDGITLDNLAASALVFVQPLGSRCIYLSDLAADAAMSRPYLDLAWPLRNDRGAHGGLLRCGGRWVAKGLGMHSAATATYRLDGPFARFDAEVGIDDRAGLRGSVRFRMLLLREGDWREAVTTGVIRGGQPPRRFSVDLTGATAIRLQVEWADHGDEGDFADWLLARLVRSAD